MISFDHVTYAYEGKETPSLRDCTFSVKPGELILLTGESGCGKTTIIKLVNGLLQHTGGGTLAGTVMVGGQDVAQTPLWELARTVGSVFQNPKSQFFNLDTTSEVLFGLESRGASHDEMAQALESAVQVCGVGPLLDRCALPGFVDSKNEEKTERNAGYLVVSHSGGGMLRQGTRKGIRRTPANRGMRAHRIVKSLDISEDVCHGLCP